MAIALFSNYYHTSTRRGIAIYTHEITRHIVDLILSEPIFLVDYFFRKKNNDAIRGFDRPNIEPRMLRIPGRLFRFLNRKINMLNPLRALERETDLIHLMHEYQSPDVNRCKRIVTVHGHGPIIYPEYFEKSYREHWIRDLENRLDDADLVICVSDGLRNIIATEYPMHEAKLLGIPLGVSDQFFAPQDKVADSAVLQTLGIQQPYLLYVGAADTNKNIVGILDAAALIKERRSLDILPNIVFAVSKSWGGYAELTKRIRRLGLQRKVILPGYVGHDHLPALYRSCKLFVFPSMFEGFGLPVAEAMACGAPCLISNRPVLEEIGGVDTRYFDPTDIDELADNLEHLLEHKEELIMMRERGKQHIAQFTWRRAAERTVYAYESILGRDIR